MDPLTIALVSVALAIIAALAGFCLRGGHSASIR
jgi:hypothetical protein